MTYINDGELNDGHIHEVIDRIHCVMDHIDNILLHHPLIDNNPVWSYDIEKIIGQFATLYSEIAKYETIEQIGVQQ